jgi:hypothetical protein
MARAPSFSLFFISFFWVYRKKFKLKPLTIALGGKFVSGVLFGKFGWILLVISFGSVLITAYFLPAIMDSLQLVFPTEWVEATRTVVQIAFGSWVGTVVVSIARIVIWLRAVFSITDMEQYSKEHRDVTYVRDFNLWLLGITTALAAFMTTWVSGE